MSYDSRGFTLIELLVVFAILAILSSISFAALRSYNNAQSLTGAVLDVKNILLLARSRALNKITPAAYCTGKPLNGYRVLICNGGNASCIPNVDYEMDVECNGTFTAITSGKFPQNSNVSVASSTTSKSFSFNPLTGAVTGNGTIVLQAPGQSTQSIIVNSNGLIQ